MVPSIYVIQKSSGQLYCVNVKHYEKYKHWYDVAEINSPIESKEDAISTEPKEIPIEPVDIEMAVENKRVKTRGK